MAEPFVKWLGGKRALADLIIERLRPQDAGSYLEPFCGGAAVYFRLREMGWTGSAVLSDANPDLLAAYRGVQLDVEGVIAALEIHQARHLEDAQRYYAIRELQRRRWEGKGLVERAAGFIYLNKTCFNGLWRENAKGQLNAALGRTSSGKPPLILDKAGLRACAAALRECRIEDGGMELLRSSREEMIYLDPPYEGTFTRYRAGMFGRDKQRELAGLAAMAANRGSRVVASNSNTAWIMDLYRRTGARRMDVVEAPRRVSRKASSRVPAKELLAVL